MFQPCNGLVLVVPDPEKKTTAGGLVLPDHYKEFLLQGTVRAVGPGRPLEGGSRAKPLVNVGDRVLFKADKDRAGNRNVIEILDDGCNCWLMNGEEILGVITGDRLDVVGEA